PPHPHLPPVPTRRSSDLGDAAIAREAGERGYFISFSGNVTYPKNDSIRLAASAAPGDRVVVETDSPFLAPQRIRGQNNHPKKVRDRKSTRLNSSHEWISY